MLFSLPGEPPFSVHVFDVRPGSEANQLQILTSTGVEWRWLDGRLDRRLALEPPTFLFPARVVPGPTGLQGYLGLVRGGVAVLFGLDGRKLASFPAGGGPHFVSADVDGDGRSEVAVETRDRKGLALFTHEGVQLWRIDLPSYLTALATLDSAGDGKAEILVHSYPTRRGHGEFRIVRADGSTVTSWEGPAVEDLCVLPDINGRPTLLTLAEDAIEIRAPDGRFVERLVAPGAGDYRDIRCCRLLAGGLVVLASGSGYRPWHAVFLYGAGKELLFHAVERDRAYSLAAAAWAPQSFFVAAGRSVYRYDLVMP